MSRVESDNESRGRSEGEEPSHNMEGMYAVLAETNNQYAETWYYFIRYDTNIEALEQLYAQLESVEWVYLESYSTFALDLENLVSPQTAKELTKLNINEGSYHRKFDGTLQFINFGFRKRDNNIVRLINVCDTIGFGGIENFIDQEDFDPEDFVTDSGSEESESEDESESESEEESRGSPETKAVRPTNKPNNKATAKTQQQQRNSSEGNSNKQEEEEGRQEGRQEGKQEGKQESRQESRQESKQEQESKPKGGKKKTTDKSTLPPPPVPPPSPAIAPTQQPDSSVNKKKSKKKN